MKRRNGILITGLMVILIGVLFSTLFMSFSFSKSKPNDCYEYVIRDSIKNQNARIIDIAMLGAHDAFSNGISMKSEPNVNEGGIVNNKIVNAIAKGFVARMSRAQRASAKELLYAGVRYFDVRITKIENEYYCFHGLLSNKLESYVKDITEFLDSHKGEFIIFDIQQYYTKDGDSRGLSDDEYLKLFEYLDALGLLKFARYDSSTPIGELRYTNITKGGTEAGIVILTKNSSLAKAYSRDSDASYSKDEYESIRSLWHNTNSFKKLLKGIRYECEYLEGKERKVLTVNQAQETGFISDVSLIRSAFKWSVIDMASNSNKMLIKNKDEFMNWLEVMPIFMVDYATSNKGNFNKIVNEYIMEYNLNL